MGSFGCPDLQNMGRGIRVASTQSHPKKKSSLLDVRILVVDDDTTSLVIVSSMLKTFSLQDRLVELSVVTVKNALEALKTLRTTNDGFDLVITDLHMPGMDGLELQKQIDGEFKIPVIIMSIDDQASVILKSLSSGAASYIVKPVKQQDLENVWQYAVEAKKVKSVVTEEMGNNDHEASTSNPKNDNNTSSEDNNSASSANEESPNRKKKGKKRIRDDQEDHIIPTAPKKAKVIWTNSLHNRFLQAISHIGLEKAVPKRILEFMNVPGLTRENVASHLQKYRMFLKKVAERGLWSSQSERALRSSFATGYSSMLFKSPLQDYSQFPGLQQLKPTFPPGYADNFSGFGFSRFPNQEASSSNSVPQYRFGQSSLFGNNSSSFQQRMFSSTSPFYQPSRTISGLLTTNPAGLNLAASGAPIFGDMNNPANGLGSSSSAVQMYQHQNPVHLTASPFFQFGTARIGSSSQASTIGSMGILDENHQTSLNPNSNYPGIRLTSDGELIRSGQGQVRFNGIEQSPTSFNGGYRFGSMNWSNINNLNNNAQADNGMFGYLTSQGGYSSASFSNFLTQGPSSSTGFSTSSSFSPTFTAGIQENAALWLPPTLQPSNDNISNAEEDDDFAFNLLNDDSPFDNIPDINQQELGEDDLSDLFFGSTNLTSADQQQVVEGNRSASSPFHFEVNSTVSELLNAEFTSACTLSDKAPPVEQSSCQIQGREETINPFGNNVNSVDGNYYPSFEQLQENNNNNEEHIGSEFNNNAAPEDQGWGDDFLDFLLGNEPF